jgi:hypothetical protein
MKKFVLLFSFVFLLTSFVSAQDYGKKGIWELGGSASFTSNSFVIDGESGDIAEGVEMPTATTFLLNIPVAYFVTDGLQIGLIPEFASLSVGNNLLDASVSAFGGFFQAAYAFKTGGSVYPYLGGHVGYSSATLKLEIDESLTTGLLKGNSTQATQTVDLTASGLGWGVNGGIKVQIAKGALLNIGIGYYQRTYTPEENADLGIPADLKRTGVDTFMGSVGFSVFLGK